MGTMRPVDLYPKILRSHEIERIKGASQQREGLPQQEEFAKKLEESAKEKVKETPKADRSEIAPLGRDSKRRGEEEWNKEKEKEEEKKEIGSMVDIKA